MRSDDLFHKRKARGAKDLARPAGKKSPYETVLIICEGETEVGYFKGLIQAQRLNTANVAVMPSVAGSAPISIVQYAIETAESRGNIDQVFCVFDRDNHESYERALDQIKSHKPRSKAKSKPCYQAITSEPCFEIWLLLHFIYTTKSYVSTGNRSACDNVIADLCQHLPNYTKNVKDLFGKISTEKRECAIENAKKLEKHNEKTGSSNPHTYVYKLVEHLMNVL